MTQTPCNVTDCPYPVLNLKRGLCSRHYQRWRKHGDPLIVLPTNPNVRGVCGVADCERLQASHGYCNVHAARYRSYGDPLGGGPFRTRKHDEAWLRSVVVVDHVDCWLWTRSLNAEGYGWMGHNGKLHLAHRFAFELFCGPIPEGFEIDHLCHNSDLGCPGGKLCLHRRCVNPDHLEAVTRDENGLRKVQRRQKMSQIPGFENEVYDWPEEADREINP